MNTKMNRVLFLTAALVAVGAASSFAQPVSKGGPLHRVESKEKAEKVPADATVALACASCQTIEVAKKGGILDWFTPDKKHDCAGCGGKITYTGAPGKSPSGLTYAHTCTKCGNASAYVCADHR